MYCLGRSGSRGNRHSIVPVPLTVSGTSAGLVVAVVITRPVSTSMMPT
jgi:hypothetical protein